MKFVCRANLNLKNIYIVLTLNLLLIVFSGVAAA